jgi:hypothetical protein
MDTPEHLYHYTSQKGLLGILESKKLWMSSILYLNDSREYTHTFDLIKSELNHHNDILQPLGLMNNIFEDIEHIIIGLSNDPVKDNYFIFSLSEIPDDLGQWRGYCPQTGGICIEFDYDKLQSILAEGCLSKEICYLSKCKYDPNEKMELLLEPIDSMLHKLESRNNDDILERFEFYLFLCVKGFSSILKHEAFKDEKEHRIVYECRGEEIIKYREGNSMIVPYIEISPVDDNDKLPISKIIVGPTPHSELSRKSVESLLKSKKYEGVDVEISKIPYRSW